MSRMSALVAVGWGSWKLELGTKISWHPTGVVRISETHKIVKNAESLLGSVSVMELNSYPNPAVKK